MKDRLPFAWDLSLENSAVSYLCFWLALLHLVIYFFFFYPSPSSSLCTVFDTISSNIDEVLSIIPLLFVFGHFNIHHKSWLTYSGGIDRPGELCYNFWILNDLIQLVNSDLRLWFSPSCSFGFVSFFWCKYLFYNGFPSIGKFWSCFCLSFHWHSIKFTMGCSISSHSLWLFLCRLGWSPWSFPWQDIFKLSDSASASDFCKWVQVRIDVYIPHH